MDPMHSSYHVPDSRTDQTNFNAYVRCFSTVVDHMQRQFHIQKCELGRLHSKKAIGVLSEIWRAVPMAVAKSIPNAVADEKKLRDVLAQCGAVEAVRINILYLVRSSVPRCCSQSNICTLASNPVVRAQRRLRLKNWMVMSRGR
jgi:hypothetical protein